MTSPIHSLPLFLSHSPPFLIVDLLDLFHPSHPFPFTRFPPPPAQCRCFVIYLTSSASTPCIGHRIGNRSQTKPNKSFPKSWPQGYFGIDLFNGSLLPSVHRALTGGFLAPGASIIPCEIRLVACVVESASIRELEEVMSTLFDFPEKVFPAAPHFFNIQSVLMLFWPSTRVAAPDCSQVMGLVDSFELASFNIFSRDTRGVQLSTYDHKLLAGPCPVLSISLAEWGGQVTRFSPS